MPGKVSVMVVDDEEAVRNILCENLADSGFDVTFARDGSEALQKLENGATPQVVITDIIMPRREGLEVIMEIRKKHPEIRLIAISGGGRTKSADFLQLAKKLGADAIMPKPLDIDTLERVLKDLTA